MAISTPPMPPLAQGLRHGRCHRGLQQAARQRQPSRDLGRPRLRHQRRRRRLPIQGRVQGSLPRFLAGAGKRRAAHARGRLRFPHHRSTGMRVQVILLDMRWFRSPLKITDQRGAPGKERYLPDPDPTKTMLGETQWAWLADELRKPPNCACWCRASSIGRRPRLGALGQLPARTPQTVRHHP